MIQLCTNLCIYSPQAVSLGYVHHFYPVYVKKKNRFCNLLTQHTQLPFSMSFLPLLSVLGVAEELRYWGSLVEDVNLLINSMKCYEQTAICMCRVDKTISLPANSGQSITYKKIKM